MGKIHCHRTGKGQDGFGTQSKAELSGLDVRPTVLAFSNAICKPCMTAVTDLSQRTADHQGKPVDRADDPDLAEKMKAEAEGDVSSVGIEGLQRLVANNFGLRRVSVSGKPGSGQA